MLRRISSILIAAVGALVPGWALGGQELPPGYELVWITRDDLSNQGPRMNNHGQIVWDQWEEGVDESAEIVLYDNGTFTQLTHDNYRDVWPDINDDGVIVWSSFRGPMGPFGPTAEIMMYRDGVITQLTDDDEYDYRPFINAAGQVAWPKTFGLYVDKSDIYWYDGSSVRRLTHDGEAEARSNQAVRINDAGHMVWTRYDFFVNPWESEIRLYDGSRIRTISPPGVFEPQVPDINNLGDAVWFYNNGTDSQALQLWHGGHVLSLTDGRNGCLNDLGHIYFIRWHEPGGWQGWLYRDHRYYQLTDDPFWNTDGDINERGEIVWRAGGPTAPRDVRALRRFGVGDLNCDGSVDAFDIEGFVVAIADPALYALLHPECDRMLADVNDDSSANAFDIDPFVDILTN
ncbi:MAG: hypothetical protein CHACPFDD_00943 [Phycisphaerae bacterium]|nr:hypothetical protein [Phycisphaerae bacterium]